MILDVNMGKRLAVVPVEVVVAVVEKVVQKVHPEDRLKNQILMVAGIEKKPPQKVAEKQDIQLVGAL